MDHLNENVPECIRQDVVAKLEERLNNFEMVHRLVKRADERDSCDNEFFLRKLRKNLKPFLISKAFCKYKTRKGNGAVYVELIEQYYDTLRRLGFQEDLSGGINIYMDYDLAQSLVAKLERIKKRIWQFKIQRDPLTPNYFVKYGWK